VPKIRFQDRVKGMGTAVAMERAGVSLSLMPTRMEYVITLETATMLRVKKEEATGPALATVMERDKVKGKEKAGILLMPIKMESAINLKHRHANNSFLP